MAVSFIAANGAAAASITTMPTRATGDLLIIAALRASNSPATVPAGWTSLGSGAFSTTLSIIVGYKFAASASEASGTWTNSAITICHVYRGAGTPPAAVFGNGSSTATTYPAITLGRTDGTSWCHRLSNHLAAGDQNATTLTGYTPRTGSGQTYSTASERSFDSNGGLSSSPAVLAGSAGNTSGGWVALSLEIPEAPLATSPRFFAMF